MWSPHISYHILVQRMVNVAKSFAGVEVKTLARLACVEVASVEVKTLAILASVEVS